ncbi:MAG: SGNH/GDSL hydrolase family protein [Actinomycetota bacterium]|nr:SGNH/GDSL hydrolase family protein [Actinomycetota bacterium]
MIRRIAGGAALAVAGLLAVLAIQAVLARRGEVAPFTEAPRTSRRFGDGPELRYVVLGDSTGAGQGADYEDGIAVATARYLAGTGRRVRLVNLSVSGAKLGDVVAEQLPLAARERPDVVLLSAGANDVTGLTSAGSIRADIERIGDALPGAKLVLTASPDVGSSPRLHPPLRWVVDLRRRQVNRAIRELADRRDIEVAPIAERTGPRFRADRALFSPDRYHPNARGYATWIPPLTEALRRTGYSD